MSSSRVFFLLTLVMCGAAVPPGVPSFEDSLARFYLMGDYINGMIASFQSAIQAQILQTQAFISNQIASHVNLFNSMRMPVRLRRAVSLSDLPAPSSWLETMSNFQRALQTRLLLAEEALRQQVTEVEIALRAQMLRTLNAIATGVATLPRLVKRSEESQPVIPLNLLNATQETANAFLVWSLGFRHLDTLHTRWMDEFSQLNQMDDTRINALRQASEEERIKAVNELSASFDRLVQVYNLMWDSYHKLVAGQRILQMHYYNLLFATWDAARPITKRDADDDMDETKANCTLLETAVAYDQLVTAQLEMLKAQYLYVIEHWSTLFAPTKSRNTRSLEEVQAKLDVFHTGVQNFIQKLQSLKQELEVLVATP